MRLCARWAVWSSLFIPFLPCSGDVAPDRFLRLMAHYKPSTSQKVLDPSLGRLLALLWLNFSLQLDVCIAEMKRQGFSSERALQHAQRWLEVVVAVCGADSSADTAASAPSRELDPDWKSSPISSRETGTACNQEEQAVAAGRCLRFTTLLLKHQPPMVDRLGKSIGATTFDSFVEVCHFEM